MTVLPGSSSKLDLGFRFYGVKTTQKSYFDLWHVTIPVWIKWPITPKVNEIGIWELFFYWIFLHRKWFDWKKNSVRCPAEVKISCDARAHSQPSFFNENIVLISPTNWYINIRAICLTFSVVPDLRTCDARAWARWPLSTKGSCQRLVSILTCSTHGGYKLKPFELL